MEVDVEVVEEDHFIRYLREFVEIDTEVASFEALLATGEEDAEEEAETDSESRERKKFDAS